MCFFEKCVGFRKLYFVLMKYNSDICIKASMNAIHRRCFVFITKKPIHWCFNLSETVISKCCILHSMCLQIQLIKHPYLHMYHMAVGTFSLDNQFIVNATHRHIFKQYKMLLLVIRAGMKVAT